MRDYPRLWTSKKGMGLQAPSELYVDGAYISAEALARAEKENRELLGPAQPSAHKENVFGAEAFEVKVEQHRAFCPAGKREHPMQSAQKKNKAAK